MLLPQRSRRRSKRSKAVRLLGVTGGVAALVLVPRSPLLRTLGRGFDKAAQALDRAIRWHKLPTPLGLLVLIGLRRILRERNLYDTETPAATQPIPPAEESASYLTARTPTGTYNDLDHPAMGMAGTRFGRNVPREDTYPDPLPDLLAPNPRTVSRELLTRDAFQPAPTLNLMAAAWLQFMVRDWFSHGKSPKDNPWELPLRDDDTWPERPMRILRTADDPTRTPAENGTPPTHVNTETHWWDASQIYGSDKAFQSVVRSGNLGKLVIGPDGLIPMTSFDTVQPSESAGWWLGLAMLHTLFHLEHNAICDCLHAEYPSWSDDELFEHARLVVAALLAKIHTVEWTTAILGHPTMQIGMRANWWGVASERIYKLVGRISDSEVVSGIPGSRTDHFGVPYAITEEFVAVYRMHPLMPDEFSFRSAADDKVLQQRTFPEIAGTHAQEILQQIPMADLLYSFGTSNPGAVTLHNYPRFLQHFERPDGILMDLASTDILRIRELGVPRYNRFRELLHLPRVNSFDDLTDNRAWAEQIRRVYENDIDRVDLMVGLFAERPPVGFGFSDTAFRIFILMASRRLNSDRFFTTDYNPRVYSPAGFDWINQNDMSTVLLRHFPALAPALRGVQNSFAPWAKATP